MNSMSDSAEGVEITNAPWSCRIQCPRVLVDQVVTAPAQWFTHPELRLLGEPEVCFGRQTLTPLSPLLSESWALVGVDP